MYVCSDKGFSTHVILYQFSHELLHQCMQRKLISVPTNTVLT